MSPSPPDRADVLALVRSSPEFVGAHDKDGWLGIFARRHVVEDPVGSRPVRSDDQGSLAAFWDAFIAPNRIEFQVAQDWVDGFDVVRDVTIVTTMKTGVRVSTPAHLIYQTILEKGALKVRRMAAYWEPAPVFRQLVRPTRAHVVAAAGQNTRMVRTLGIGASVRFVGAIRTVGRRGKRHVLDTLATRGITEVSKVIAAGRSVTVSCVVDGSPAAVIADLAPRSRELTALTLYTDPA